MTKQSDELIACFDMAFDEGLQEALENTTDGHLKDLIERRLLAGYYKIMASEQAEQQAITSESGAIYAELPAPTASIGVDDTWHEAAMRDFADRTHAKRASHGQAPAATHPIAPDVAADLERSDWTPEEALRWYAAGKHYDTVPNGDGTSSARILDNGAVASNALKSMSRDYAEHKGDVALSAGPALALAELLRLLTDKTPFPSYFCNHKERYECCDCGEEHGDYAEIVHTETCDSVKAVADRTRIAELVGVLKSTPTPTPTPPAECITLDEFRPCPCCFGAGVEGTADDYGHTIDVACGECNGSGRDSKPTPPAER